MLKGREIDSAGERLIKTLRIKTPSVNEATVQLSGGNQQKVVIGKWINCDVDIYLFDEPTRGIDVGAKVEVYNIMNELVEQGKCVIMVSSELPEVLGMSDRVVVMREGRVVAEMDSGSKHFNQEDIMKAAWGGNLE
jgi:ribose transport system ATP-binding protein